MSVSHKELLSPNIRMGIELLDICNRARVSLKVFDEIVQYFKRNSKHGVDPEEIPSRDRLYKIFRKNFKVAPPEMVPVPSAPNIFVPKFPFLDQLINIFSMDLFRDPCMSNICVNPDEKTHFSRYIVPYTEGLVPYTEGRLEIMSGKWYRDTYFECIGDQAIYVDPETGEAYDNWFVPVQFYNNKTGSSPSEGSYTLEPFVFTLGIIRREIRERWIHSIL